MFDFDLVEDLVECVGWEMKALDLVEPYHMIALARKKLMT